MNKLAPLVQDYLQYGEAEKARDTQSISSRSEPSVDALKITILAVPLAEIAHSFKDDEACLSLFWVRLFEALIDGQFEGSQRAYYIFEFPIRQTRFSSRWVNALCSDWFSPSEVKEELARLWCSLPAAIAFVERTPFLPPRRWQELTQSPTFPGPYQRTRPLLSQKLCGDLCVAAPKIDQQFFILKSKDAERIARTKA